MKEEPRWLVYINALHFRDTVSFYELLPAKGKKLLHSDGWSFLRAYACRAACGI